MLCGALGLVRAIGFRDPAKRLIDGDVDRIGGLGPAVLRATRRRSCTRSSSWRGRDIAAPATPGDLLFHIRAESMDVCFELAGRIVDAMDGAITVVDEVHGFRFFDNRDLLGFVDGTENPGGPTGRGVGVRRRRGRRLRRRQLRNRAEVRTRHGVVELPVGHRAGARDRPDEARRHRIRRRREARERAHRAQRDHRRGRQ